MFARKKHVFNTGMNIKGASAARGEFLRAFCGRSHWIWFGLKGESSVPWSKLGACLCCFRTIFTFTHLYPPPEPGAVSVFFPSACASKLGVSFRIYSHVVSHWMGIGHPQYWLVLWNMAFMTFASYWECLIIPTDFHSIIFHRGRWLNDQPVMAGNTNELPPGKLTVGPWNHQFSMETSLPTPISQALC
jgi:hypothetical protein